MGRMTSLYLGILFLSFTITVAHSFELPSIGDIFNNLANNRYEETEPEVHSREKRQDPGIGDESQQPYEVKSSTLPMKQDKVTINDRYMPTLGNGHIGVTVYNDSLHLNGLYNGAGPEAHRAKIPALIMARVNLSDPEIERRAIRKYTFNVKDGYFMETIDCDFAYIEHKMYAHQKYIRLLVSDIYARKKDGALGGGVIHLTFPQVNETSDIRFNQKKRYYSNWQVMGTTREAEQGSSTQNVHVFWHELLGQISIRGSTTEVNETTIMAIDRQESNARSDFDAAVHILEQRSDKHGHYQLLREHIDAWHDIWDQGRIEIEGDITLAKITQFSQYYLLSSLPPLNPKLPPQHSEYFYGMGRTGLAKGSSHHDYQGQTMWDSEMYILPAVVLFHPELAKKMLRYRSENAQRAKLIAEEMGSVGYKFPWGSAYSGREVSPDELTCGKRCLEKRYHNTAAIGWAIRQYWSATRDRDYIINTDYNGCDMTREIARFFADRAVYNPSKGRYDINNVTGPDLDHPNVNNNAYTIAAASLAIHWGRYMACVCNRNERDEVPDDWIQKALYLNLPFDNVKRLHHQYEGFDDVRDRPIRQADAILLTYPLNWNMSTDIMRNDLQLYEQMTDDRSPAMTWSFFTIGFKWVNEIAKRDSYFLKSYQDYLIQPFKIWTEYNERSTQDQEEGSVNFLPGMGGYLQSLIYGFAGIRIRPEFIEFHNPQPPQGVTRMKFIGFNYLGASMTIEIEFNTVKIEVHSLGEYNLVLIRNDTSRREENMPAGGYVTIEDSQMGFTIRSLEGLSCEHPRDYIYMPWGYSPWIDGASYATLNSSLWLLILTVTVLMRR